MGYIRRMLWISILFIGFIVVLAKAPDELIKVGLTLLWALMAFGCAASVASTLAPRLFS